MKIIKISAVWCPSCLVMRSRFEEIERKYKEIEFKTLDIDFDEEANNFEIGNTLPVLILLDDNGQELSRLIGEKKIEEMIETIENYLS